MGIRTDLALEAATLFGADIPGITSKTEEHDGLTVSRIEITSKEGSEALGKPLGRYVTIDCPDIKYSTELYEETLQKIADEIQTMADIRPDTKTLVVGLGNDAITPDALGPEVVRRLLVTGHVKEQSTELFGEEVSAVYAIAPGVLGTTGIESAEVIEAVVKKVNPDLIIAVDALASKSLDRISTTFQLTDTGISPGAGVENKRKALNEETLGKKVIAIGVPTVVDAMTVALDSLELGDGSLSDEKSREELIERILTKEIARLMVTPKDIDLVIERTSKTVANGINRALHKNLTLEEIESYVG